jgi:hypothetical protein
MSGTITLYIVYINAHSTSLKGEKETLLNGSIGITWGQLGIIYLSDDMLKWISMQLNHGVAGQILFQSTHRLPCGHT